MAKYNTFMNELPESDSSHPWTKVSETGSVGITYNKLVYAAGSDRVYKREDGQAKTDDVDVRLSIKFTDSISSSQYIYIDDGVDKLIEVIFSSSGVKINGGTYQTLTPDSYASIRIKKTAQTNVKLYINDFDTEVSTVAYANIPTASTATAGVHFKFIAATNQTVWLDYLNYAIGEDADGLSATRINTLMAVTPEYDPSDPWTLGVSDGSWSIANGNLVVGRNGATSANLGYSRTTDTYGTTDELDVAVYLNIKGSNASFKTYVNDGVKGVLLTVERTTANGYRFYLNSEVPQSLIAGFHFFRIVKTGETNVKVYVDNGASPTYSIAYASLPANATKKMEMLITADSALAENKVYVDYYNYGVNIDAYEQVQEAAEVRLMKIQPETGALQEHDDEADAIKFEQVKTKKYRSDGDMSIKTVDGDMELYSSGDLYFISHVSESLPPVGNPDGVIGGTYHVGNQATETAAVRFASTEDATYELPEVDGVTPNSLMHTLKLLSLRSNERAKTFTAGENITSGKAVRFSGANTVVTASNSSLSNAKIIGIAETGVLSGESVLVTLEGGIAESTLSGANVNDTYYLTSTGSFSTTVPPNPGDIVMQVGYASSTTDLFIAFGVPYERS